MNRYFKKPFFRKMFYSYAAVLILCSFIFIGVLIQQAQRQDEKAKQQDCRSKAILLTQLVDEKFLGLDKIGIQLDSTGWVRKVRSKSEILSADIDVLKRKEICQEIGNYSAMLQIASSFSLIFPQKNIVVDNVSFWESDRYFSSIGLSENPLEGGLETAVEKSMNSLFLYRMQDNTEPSDNHFIVARQMDYSAQPVALLFCYINGKQFSNYISKNMKKELYSFEILSNDQVIFHTGKTTPNNDIFEEIYPSKMYNWSYRIQMYPTRSPIASRNLLFIAGLVLSVLLGIVLAFLLAKASYAPISLLLNRLDSKAGDTEHEFTALERVFKALKEEKSNLENLSSQYYNTVRGNLLLSLLQGSLLEETKTDELMKFGLPYQDDRYYMVGIFDYGESNNAEQRAVDYLNLSAYCDDQNFSAQLVESADERLIIVLADCSDSQLFMSSNLLRNYCDKHFGQDITFCCGLPLKGLMGISKSYQEAKEQSLKPENEIRTVYYYPIDWEIQLISQLKMGNQETAGRILNELKTENLKRKLSKEDNSFVASLILGILLRVAADMDIEFPLAREEFAKISASDDLEWPWDYLLGIKQVLCSKVDDSQSESSQKTGIQIKAYIEEHFCDSSLSQQQIADIFHVSRSMVSKIFKNTAKVNFIDYLHQLRIQKAKQYFDNGDTDVLDVARKTGYENELTFKRAFLRIEAITPRKYVQQCKKIFK